MFFSRYIDPTTDFGFKRLFGQEESKDILKQFLFDILELPHPIVELQYLPSEQTPAIAEERLGIYDVYCVDSEGQRFIVEMQRNRQANYKERVLFYATFPIVHQVRKNEEEYGIRFKLLPIYCISVLNFLIDQESQSPIRRVQLADMETGKVFYRGLTFVFLELPKFSKSLEELSSGADRWMYFLKHLPDLETIPEPLAHEPFPKAFHIAAQASMTRDEKMLYDRSIKQKWDEKGLYYTGVEEGREEGLQEGIKRGLREGVEKGRQEGEKKGRLATAKQLLPLLDDATISQSTGLPLEQVQALRLEHQNQQ